MNWPEHLIPLPSEAYSAQGDPFLARTEFEVGMRQRSRYSGVEEKISVNWILSQFELDVLEAVVQRSLNQGADEFEMSILGLDGVRRETVQIVGGALSKEYLSGSYYRVAATLRVKPKTLGDPEVMAWLLYLEDGAADGLIELAEVLDLYLERHYGESISSPAVVDFMLTHS